MAKKMGLGLVLVFMTAAGAFAQQKWYNSYSPSIWKSKALLNVGLGLGPTGGYKMGLPPITASLDFKMKNIPITLGGFGTFSTWKWDFPGVDPIVFTNIGFGGRAQYHFNLAKKLDTYAGLSLGYVIQSVNSEYGAAASFFLWGFNWGGRFFFTNRVGAYLEVGYSGLQFASLGLTFKL